MSKMRVVYCLTKNHLSLCQDGHHLPCSLYCNEVADLTEVVDVVLCQLHDTPQ